MNLNRCLVTAMIAMGVSAAHAQKKFVPGIVCERGRTTPISDPPPAVAAELG